jgi:hypothetical protein
MEKQNDSMRERLLARLPQPENLSGYREETASLVAKHERALFWEKWSVETLFICSIVLYLMIGSNWGQTLFRPSIFGLYGALGFTVIGTMLTGLRYYISRSRVDMLKEVKQVQLQVLELQASLQKRDGQ